MKYNKKILTQRISIFALSGIIFSITGCNSDDDNGEDNGSSNPPVGENQVADIDGNVYNTVTIGDAVWMKENLRTTTLADGTPITEIADPEIWGETADPGYAVINNDPETKSVYGLLYNGYAAEIPNLCPEGWRVPDNFDFSKITLLLGSNAGSVMKDVDSGLWEIPEIDIPASDSTGFSARPAGSRNRNSGEFGGQGRVASFWSIEQIASYSKPSYRIAYNYSDLSWDSNHPRTGLCIRCVKDD